MRKTWSRMARASRLSCRWRSPRSLPRAFEPQLSCKTPSPLFVVYPAYRRTNLSVAHEYGPRAALNVETRVKHYSRNQEKQQARARATHFDPGFNPVHFHNQVLLFFGHVGFRISQE